MFDLTQKKNGWVRESRAPSAGGKRGRARRQQQGAGQRGGWGGWAAKEREAGGGARKVGTSILSLARPTGPAGQRGTRRAGQAAAAHRPWRAHAPSHTPPDGSCVQGPAAVLTHQRGKMDARLQTPPLGCPRRRMKRRRGRPPPRRARGRRSGVGRAGVCLCGGEPWRRRCSRRSTAPSCALAASPPRGRRPWARAGGCCWRRTDPQVRARAPTAGGR